MLSPFFILQQTIKCENEYSFKYYFSQITNYYLIDIFI
jgi:hypothetical protein